MSKSPVTTRELVLSALVGLVFGCLIMGVAYGVGLALRESFGVIGAFGLAAYAAVAGYLVGILITLAYGVPAYAYLLDIGRANYFSTSVAGGIPSFILLAWSYSTWHVVLVCGVSTSIATHFLVKRRVFQAYRQRA